MGSFQVWPPQKIVPRKVLDRMRKIKRMFTVGISFPEWFDKRKRCRG